MLIIIKANELSQFKGNQNQLHNKAKYLQLCARSKPVKIHINQSRAGNNVQVIISAVNKHNEVIITLQYGSDLTRF
jgi:hypothetical protein